MENSIAIFAGGCFWCTEAIFEKVKGVLNVESGYAGPSENAPSYEEISTGKTDFVEAIKIIFDESIVSYKDLLEIFFETHNPTTLNKQGNDVGPQYSSVIFYVNNEQKQESLKYINKLENSKKYSNSIVTKVVEFKNFHVAEEYHQNFYKNNPEYGYCQVIISPKIKKLEQKFLKKLK